MSISLTPQTQKLVEEQMKKGGYQSPDDVVKAGMASLALHGDFEPGEMDRLLAEGEADIGRRDVIDGEIFFQQLEKLSAFRRKAPQ